MPAWQGPRMTKTSAAARSAAARGAHGSAVPAWQVPRMTKTSASARSATSRYAQAYAGPPRRKSMCGAITARTGGAPAGRPAAGGPRPLRRREARVEGGVERVRLRRVGAARVGGGPQRRLEERAVHGGPPRRKALALEEALRVERVGDGLDLLAREQLAVAPHHRRLDVGDRVLAVEERDDLEEHARQEDDRVRVARRVAQRDARLPLVLDGEGIDLPQAGRGLAHGVRKFRAAAT